MDFFHINCPYCDKKYSSLNSLRIHAVKIHNITSQQLYINLFCNGEHPTCDCGCGEKTRFLSIQRGFANLKKGHISRIKNNWGHNKNAQLKSQNIRRIMHKKGEIKIWNKGLTSKMDYRIAAYAKLQSNNFTNEKRKIYSKRMSANRLIGVIPTLTGSQHSQWKGGTSNLQPHIRSHIFNYWSRPIMKRDDFSCQICGQTYDLCVHHCDKHNTFSKILNKAIKIFGEYNKNEEGSYELKKKITNFVIDYHVSNNVKGITLCHRCHEFEHRR